jgi:hypothetical protein
MCKCMHISMQSACIVACIAILYVPVYHLYYSICPYCRRPHPCSASAVRTRDTAAVICVTPTPAILARPRAWKSSCAPPAQPTRNSAPSPSNPMSSPPGNPQCHETPPPWRHLTQCLPPPPSSPAIHRPKCRVSEDELVTAGGKEDCECGERIRGDGEQECLRSVKTCMLRPANWPLPSPLPKQLFLRSVSNYRCGRPARHRVGDGHCTSCTGQRAAWRRRQCYCGSDYKS